MIVKNLLLTKVSYCYCRLNLTKCVLKLKTKVSQTFLLSESNPKHLTMMKNLFSKRGDCNSKLFPQNDNSIGIGLPGIASKNCDIRQSSSIHTPKTKVYGWASGSSLPYSSDSGQASASYKPFVCSLCGKCYKTSGGLTLHMQMHSGHTFMCPICQSRFPYKGNLKRHLNLVHNSVQCQNCFAVYQSDESHCCTLMNT